MSITPRHLIVKEDDKIVETDIGIHSNDDIPDGVEINFLTKDEIANDLVDRVLSGEDKASVKTETAEELNGLTTSLGSFIIVSSRPSSALKYFALAILSAICKVSSKKIFSKVDLLDT